MSVHSVELASAEATATPRTKGLPDHWKPWKPDALDALGRVLGKAMKMLDAVVGGNGRGYLCCISYACTTADH